MTSSVKGTHNQRDCICALKGSSVNLSCSAQHPGSSKNWCTVHRSKTDHSLDGNRGKYSISEETNFTLTVSDQTERDERFYCCRKPTATPEDCRQGSIHLHVADLQVKVFPTTEGLTVTLMCSTSCPLTEKPAAFIWYKNREFLYEDWSPWYQELVSSEEAVRYSCAIKGYEELRAPEVSVGEVTPVCFSVTYAKGRMCSYKQTSLDESCSITYPREIHVQQTAADISPYVTLACITSCNMTDPLIPFTWYKNTHIQRQYEEQQISVTETIANSFSCAVQGLEDLRSADFCVEDGNCWSVNYVSRRICAFEGSSVNISSEYWHSPNKQPESKLWYKEKGNADEVQVTDNTGDVRYHDNMRNQHTLRLKNVKESDSAEYKFRIQKASKRWRQSGVTLIITGLRVKITPSAEVTEGQRVTLTCSTSCPLTDNTNYIWYFNSRPLTLPEHQNKHLLLDPVSSQHAGKYSCAVRTNKNFSSTEKSLTVHSIPGKWEPAAAGVSAALLVLILLAVFLWMRKKKTSSQSFRNETMDNLEQINSVPECNDISAQPTEQELHYSQVHFSQNQAVPLYSNIQPLQSHEQECAAYAVVSFRSNTTPSSITRQ
ncbi:B-cell receptor CD22-like [Brachyistius frenatus]|uniref:B-cell receptor CD22-like n=1 Tax=Brachyistius frenatus TaxID=100188 RepID=UPI0037E8CE2E